ncbi:MAG TPA: SRPBCC family protein [Acidimicrobiia bacterium]|jgi:ribosome-associated toxin RatA of RatAB toxin-antitoxin module
MADEAVEHIRIGAPPQRCFEVAVDFEHYPRWATDVKEVEVLARDAEGRGTKVRFAVAAMGRTLGYILDYDYADAPTEFSWKLAQADLLRVLDGSYHFDPDADAGEAGTALTYKLAVDLNLPLPGFVKRRAAGMIIQNAVQGFKRYLEAGAGDAA